jgi:hypothetical protein
VEIGDLKWIIDDMVLNDLANTVPAINFAGWPDLGLMLADATAKAASSGSRQALLAARSLATSGPVFTPFSVTVGSEAWNILYGHLRTGSSNTANLAEHQSIAWALTHSDEETIFVTRDKHAAMVALSELGRGRVCHPYELFEYLCSRGCLTQQQFDNLKNSTKIQDQSIKIPWRLQRD